MLTSPYLAIALLLSLAGNGMLWLARDNLKLEVEAQKAAIKARDATATAAAEHRAREIEAATAEAAATAATEYQRGLEDARLTSDRVVADLRAGNLRLRREWGSCETQRLSEAAATAARADGPADDLASRAGRIVRAADECTAQVKGLQALVRADRSAQ